MDCEAIFNEATAAAHAAIRETVKKFGSRQGACGFAWVVVRPARGKFISWCKAQKKLAADRYTAARYGSNHWAGGWEFWMPGREVYNGQDCDVFYAGAVAFAEVLNKYGINASACSRLD